MQPIEDGTYREPQGAPFLLSIIGERPSMKWIALGRGAASVIVAIKVAKLTADERVDGDCVR